MQFVPAVEEAGLLAGELRRLRSERGELQRGYDRLQRDLADAEEFAAGSVAFESVANEQRARLQSVKLFTEEASNSCTLCQQNVESQVPRVANVRKALETVAKHVDAVGLERPALTEHIKDKSAEMSAVAQRLTTNREALNALTARDNELRAQQNQDLVRSRVAGQVEMYLEGLRQRTIFRTSAEVSHKRGSG